MLLGSRVHLGGTDGSYGATTWCRATLELRRSLRVAARVPLWGNSGRVSTNMTFLAAASGEASEVGKAGKAAAVDVEAVWWQEVGNVAHTGTKAGGRQREVGWYPKSKTADRTSSMREHILRSEKG
ncbi:hypothetical protein NDU88_005849 [Pleurodeles waltl]|uniref:Uncharacterized protein n=1 Tax=Pleurodeles waltl TaxID=8319 RepID=A0AAV7TBV3_PLEWA|nr:hypothetical protein NDU88_005849 [Pleurodeles waltl]